MNRPGPCKDDQIFEIRIDRKIDSWSGSLELGVTTADPMELAASSGHEFPSSANELSQGSSWIMSGNTVRQDGKSVHENYGDLDLDQVKEQDRVGVVRTSQGDLVFFINGVSQSVAARSGHLLNSYFCPRLFLTPAAEKTKTQAQNSRKKLNLRGALSSF